MTTKTTHRPFILTILVITLFLSYNFINAAWTAPGGNPPTNNTEAPVNVGTATQTKNSRLDLRYGTNMATNTARIMFQTNGAVVGNIFAASAEMRSNLYCDNMGNNCFDPNDVGGAGTAGNKTCGDLPVCGSTDDSNKNIDCRIGGVDSITGGALCVTRRNIPNGPYTWGHAMSACVAKYGPGYRLPTVDEAQVIRTRKSDILNINNEGGTWPWHYWTLTYSDSNDGMVAGVNMDGTAWNNHYTTRTLSVRCVRGNLP